VLVIEPDGRLLGAVPTIALLKGNADSPIETAASLNPARVRVDDDLPEIAILMADYNLTIVPVTDRDGRLVGAISVDDLLEAVLPDDWRRRAEASQGG
jgi:Mg/Co/Ni transporter MgtE